MFLISKFLKDSEVGGQVKVLNSSLSQFSMLDQNTIDYVAYKRPILISHRSEGWEVQDQDTGRLASGENSLCASWMSFSSHIYS